jgi:DNA segregation ATPase FtsK/SpoIIIE, S-DNA-T family
MVKEKLELSDDKKLDSLNVEFGSTLDGNTYICDLATTYNILVGGSKGSGKSNFLRNIIDDLSQNYKSDRAKFVLVDFKKGVFSRYENLPHLYTPIVNTAKHYYSIIGELIEEVDARLNMFKEAGCYNIKDYNDLNLANKKIPHIVVIVDEFKSLILSNKDKFENTLSRLSLKARAAGIVVIYSTRKINAISGMVKANLINRISFKVRSKKASRIALDAEGAEKLKKKREMLFFDINSFDYIQIKCKLVKDKD